MTGNIYLTGFMGAGKTTLGRLLARRLRRRFVDMDERLSARFGLPVTEIFARRGEDAFRRAETDLLRRLAGRERQVVATGGGTPISAANRELMRGSGWIVHLDASLETCRQRLGPEALADRPLWTDDQDAARIHQSRRQAYVDCDFTVGVNGSGPEASATAVMARLIPEERFLVRLGHEACPVIATVRGELVSTELVRDRRVVLLSERRVAGLHLDRYRGALGHPIEVIVAPGERSKSLTSARRIYEALLQAGVERQDLLVAVGGGMVTDLGAFVAATYKRGIDFILASTSLVGCVDAAVGGKAGVNLGRSKNMVGCFTAPRAVILDVTALSTLPRRQIAEGLVEAYKTGLVAEPALADLIETRIKDLLVGDLEALARVAVMSARAKADVVGIDFKEGGLRSILNLGHTYGHAVEGHHRFRVSHGRAVALGLLVAAELSLGRGLIDPEQARRIGLTLSPLLPDGLTLPSPDEAWALMRGDKKNRGGRIRFVLLEGPGRARLADDVTRDELAGAVARLEKMRDGS